MHAYLGTRDGRLPAPIADLVPAAAVCGYPTDLRAMPPRDLDNIMVRAEQLTRTLIAHYCPDLG